MEALIGFLKLEDPSSKMGGGIRGGSLRGSGKKGRIASISETGVRRNRKIGSREKTASWQSGDTNADGDGGLSSSFTSFKDSAGMLSKLLVRMCFFSCV